MEWLDGLGLAEKFENWCAAVQRSVGAGGRAPENPPPLRPRFPGFASGALHSGMIRPVLTELALFVAPFVIYAIYLWATRAGVLHPESWPLSTLMWLTIAALLLMAGSFIVLAQWGGEPPGRTTSRRTWRTASSFRGRRSEDRCAVAQ